MREPLLQRAADADADADAAPVAELARTTLVALQWDAVCAAVASHAESPAGDAVARAGLPLASTRRGAEALLAQTGEAGAHAVALAAAVGSAPDVRPALDAARGGARLPGRQLLDVGRSLLAAEATAVVCDAAGPALASLSPLLRSPPPSLRITLCDSLTAPGGSVSDAACPVLRAARASRRAASTALRTLLQHHAQRLAKAGACDSPQVVSRRERLCVPVKRGLVSSLLPGGVVLAASDTGLTLFVEPEDAIQLNNEVAAASLAVAAAEAAVLARLSRLVEAHAEQVEASFTAVAAADGALARARFAARTGGDAARVRFSGGVALGPRDTEEGEQSSRDSLGGAVPAPTEQTHSVWLPGVLHPLLMARSCEAPPKRAWEEEHVPSFFGAPQSLPSPLPPRPHPIDWLVPLRARCALLTGANAGGKTAAMKTLALVALLARAGVPPPLAAPLPPHATAVVPFASTVLCDLGDGQSLAEGLSTFGSHVRSLSCMLSASAASTPSSPLLALLDEPGGGTDPDEGGALATALLTSLCSSPSTTVVATTHYTQLKRFAVESSGGGAAVASVCAPGTAKYALTWGTAGESRALATARASGISPSVVDDAEARHAAAGGAGGAAGRLMEALAAEAEAAVIAADAAAALAASAEARASAAVARAAALRAGEGHLSKAEAFADAAALRSALASISSAASRSPQPDADIDAAVAAAAAKHPEWAAAAARRGGGGEHVSVGDRVRVPRFANRAATVVEIDADGEGARVSLGGALTATVKLSELTPWRATDGDEPSGGGAGAKQPPRAAAMLAPRVTRSAAAAEAAVAASAPAAAEGAAARMAVASPRADNTVDVRGLYPTEAVSVVEAAVGARTASNGAAGTVLFVVHGVGTGAVKQACLDFLRTCPVVARVQQAPQRDGGAGCSVAFIV